MTLLDIVNMMLRENPGQPRIMEMPVNIVHDGAISPIVKIEVVEREYVSDEGSVSYSVPTILLHVPKSKED
jgi:hypothetical protein